MTFMSRCLAISHTCLLLGVLALTGCAQSVRVDGSRPADVAPDQSFTRVLVVGLSPHAGTRCDFESFLATQIRSAGADAKASCNLMNTADPLTRESIEAVVAKYGADAVLTTVLVHAAMDARTGGSGDTRGAGYYKPTDIGYDNYFYGGYGYGAYGVPVVEAEFRTAAPIMTVDGDVTIRSMLYATRDARLVYELTTKAGGLSSRDNALGRITPEIAQHLQKEGLLRSNGAKP